MAHGGFRLACQPRASNAVEMELEITRPTSPQVVAKTSVPSTAMERNRLASTVAAMHVGLRGVVFEAPKPPPMLLEV